MRTVLGPLPHALDGIRVEVHHTIAPQLVLENSTARAVEVLDDGGVALLRIGPSGVEGNVGASAWYWTQGPAAPIPVGVRDESEPRWRRARSEPSYGRFGP